MGTSLPQPKGNVTFTTMAEWEIGMSHSPKQNQNFSMASYNTGSKNLVCTRAFEAFMIRALVNSLSSFLITLSLLTLKPNWPYNCLENMSNLPQRPAQLLFPPSQISTWVLPHFFMPLCKSPLQAFYCHQTTNASFLSSCVCVCVCVRQKDNTTFGYLESQFLPAEDHQENMLVKISFLN